MKSDYHGKHKERTKKRFFAHLRFRWSQMARIDKLINVFLGLAIIVLIVSVTIMVSSNRSSKSADESSTSSSVTSSYKKSHQQANTDSDEDGTEVSNSSDVSDNDMDFANSSANVNSNSESSKSKGRVNHGEVSEGMNAEYRMARQAGLIDGDWSTESIHDFYNNVQDNEDGSFTYNGKTVYVQRTYQGNPNGIESGGSIYTDPDRYTITTDQ
ncbi:hypothetical protein [Limosilactobacillus albertensis]|uniref:Uncharacterized protein n=1 Tax=Limosilactobacillus albertensis TaxID=2759752 RepID=A0A839H840_9LACO|nr:hypothetical protein [Limosilactobacillus albertensis]MBB1122837.1 hypothetical protein [Limosilactobacillus albertensis]MCD7122519.1 hypothetical protein [Limosilactobacillus albertensis]